MSAEHWALGVSLSVNLILGALLIGVLLAHSDAKWFSQGLSGIRSGRNAPQTAVQAPETVTDNMQLDQPYLPEELEDEYYALDPETMLYQRRMIEEFPELADHLKGIL